MKVLIVEDERQLAGELEEFLSPKFLCEVAYDGRTALKKIDEGIYDFVLLDLGLPDIDGIEVLKEIRDTQPESAVIILTARAQLEDRIAGLDMGADDYLPKPFSLLELQSRIQAIIRRKFNVQETMIELGDFRMDIQKRMINYSGQTIDLSRKEFDVLYYLALNLNRPVTRMQLSEHLWGDYAFDDYDSNYIDVHIKNIRKKLNSFGSTEWLETVRGIGYKIRVL